MADVPQSTIEGYVDIVISLERRKEIEKAA